MKELRLAFTYPRGIGQPHQNPFWTQQTGHRLTPRLLPCGDQEPIALCFQLFRCLGNVFHVKFQPGGRRGQIARPFVHAKAGLGCLRKRPEGKRVDPFKLFRVEVAIGFFFERETQAVSIESRAFLRICGDRAISSNK